LTVLAKSQSVTENQEEFEGSNYVIWIAKKLVAEKGIPDVKPGKVLPPATA
jgi:hypothetical protein